MTSNEIATAERCETCGADCIEPSGYRWLCERHRGDGRTLFFHLFSIDVVSASGIDYVDVELPNGNVVRYHAPLAGQVLSERAFQSIAAAKCIGKVRRPWLNCAQCGLAKGRALGWVTVCDPNGEPISAWLHRECEAAFLSRGQP